MNATTDPIPIIHLKPVPKSWAKLLGVGDPTSLRYASRITGVPPWLTRRQLVAAIARANELQALLGAPFVVSYDPDASFEDDDDSMGHLFSVRADVLGETGLTDGTLDDRDPDLQSQLRTWLLKSAATLQAAAARVGHAAPKSIDNNVPDFE